MPIQLKFESAGNKDEGQSGDVLVVNGNMGATVTFDTWQGRPQFPQPRYEIIHRPGSKKQFLQKIMNSSDPTTCIATIQHNTPAEADAFYWYLLKQMDTNPEFSWFGETEDDILTYCYLLSVTRTSCKKMCGPGGNVWFSVFNLVINTDQMPILEDTTGAIAAAENDEGWTPATATGTVNPI